MPRKVDLTVPSDRTDALLTRIDGMEGLIGVQVQRGISRQPEGDVITLEITNRGFPALALLLSDEGVGSHSGTSFSTSEPLSVVSSSAAAEIVRDVSESSWEEMEVVIGKNSNVTVNAALVMGVSGVLAAVGIATNALHIVVGAMLIAPGFQPVVRIALGVVAQSGAWQRGVVDTLRGYLVLAIGAAATALLLRALGMSPLGDEASYLPAGTLISYWTTISASSVVTTFTAGLVGALLVATNRAVLTAGVMVALALVPGAAIAGMAAASGEYGVAVDGAIRWLMEVGLVLLSSVLVLGWKRSRVHNRRMLL